MARDKLLSYHLTRDKKRGGWQLEKAGSDRATARFATKEEALKAGALRAAVGKEGGSVKITQARRPESTGADLSRQSRSTIL